MSGLTQLRAEEAIAAITANQADTAQALERTFGDKFQVEPGAATSGGLNRLPDALEGPGLLFVFRIEDATALGLLPESTGLVPGWCEQPDATGKSKLQTLGVELGCLLFPEALMATDCLVARVKDLQRILQRAGCAEDCSSASLRLSAGGKTGHFTLVWPASQSDSLVADEPDPPAPTAAAEATNLPGVAPATSATVAPPLAPASPISQPTSPVSKTATSNVASGTPAPRGALPPENDGRRGPIPYRDLDDGLRCLPPYARSLLKIPVPVTVTLAEARQPLRAILEIGPGSIIHFNKSCEDTLTLEVAGQKFAVGETVKVGDKFGLWITAIILPDERFWVIGARHSGTRAR